MSTLKRVPGVFWQVSIVLAGVGSVAAGVSVLAGWPWALIGVGLAAVVAGLLVDI